MKKGYEAAFVEIQQLHDKAAFKKFHVGWLNAEYRTFVNASSQGVYMRKDETKR